MPKRGKAAFVDFEECRNTRPDATQHQRTLFKDKNPFLNIDPFESSTPHVHSYSYFDRKLVTPSHAVKPLLSGSSATHANLPSSDEARTESFLDNVNARITRRMASEYEIEEPHSHELIRS